MAGIFDRMMSLKQEDQIEETEKLLGQNENSETALSAGTISDSSDDKRTHQRVREAVQELLKYGLLEESHKPNLYRVALANSEEMRTILEPLDLDMRMDDVRGLIFVTVRQVPNAEQDEWGHPLVRRQRLNLEQSLLIAILRQHFIAYEQESGAGANQAQVALDDLIPQLQVYFGDMGSDARERTRIVNLLDQLKGHGLVSALDAHDRVLIRPIIAHLLNPENLQALIAGLRDQVGRPDMQADTSALTPTEDME
jgi:hypothetical protein